MKRTAYIVIGVVLLALILGMIIPPLFMPRQTAHKAKPVMVQPVSVQVETTSVKIPEDTSVPDLEPAIGKASSDDLLSCEPDSSIRSTENIDSRRAVGSRTGSGRKRTLTAQDKGLAARDLGDGADGEKIGERIVDDVAIAETPTGEGYAPLIDNAFVHTGVSGGDASTFGLDVDTASYSNVRRLLLAGQRPPANAVRIEEMLNSFTYAYPAPTGEHPLAATATMSDCPWAPGHRLLRVAVTARSVDKATRPPVSVVFLVDVSGSMQSSDKLPLVVTTLERFCAGLDERDRVAIVTYAGSDRVVLESTPGNEHQRIKAALKDLKAGGGTNGAGGIRRAYDEVARNRVPGSVGRVVLCTDGDFNIGESDPERLKTLIAEQATSGTFLNVFGFGTGNYQDATAEALADRGNGVYAYIDSDEQAKRTVEEGLMGQLVTVAKDSKVQVFFNPTRIAAWRQIGYENRRLKREDFNNDRKDAGDVGAGHQVTVLYELVPSGGAQTDANPFLPSTVQAPAEGPALRLRLRYKQPTADTSRLIEQDVPDRVVAMDDDLRFAAAVAGFGMLLRASPHRGDCTWAMVADLASAGGDVRRVEFKKLVHQAAAVETAK